MFITLKLNIDDIITIFIKHQVLKEEISHIFENLDEAIICKSSKGISFCNKFGFNIIKNIQTIRLRNLQNNHIN